MFAGIKRALAIALLAAPVPAFAGDNADVRSDSLPVVAMVTVNTGQGGFITVPIVQNTGRTYSLTGIRASNSHTINYRFGQGDVLIRVPN